MIQQLIIYDIRNLRWITLFDNKKVKLNTELLIRVVHAMTTLTKSIEGKGELREAELGKYQIGLKAKDDHAYVLIQNSTDNEPFTSRILELLIENIHDDFLEELANETLSDELKQRIEKLLLTMKFPLELLPDLSHSVEAFRMSTLNIVTNLFLADLDDGVVHHFVGEKGSKIERLLMEILSEIPFEKRWIAELKKNGEFKEIDASHEVWFISRIGLTDYTIMGRGAYNPEVDKETLDNALDELCEYINSRLFEDQMNTL